MGFMQQPHVIVLCSNLEQFGRQNTTAIYVILQNNLYYEVSSIPEAIDICIKSIFVFNLQYCAASASSWTFLQKCVYSITTNYDISSSRMLELISEL